MLAVLRLRDFAIVADAELEFDAGLNAITGETGAGKSLIVGALQLLVGGRSSARWVRTGCSRAEVEAQFVGVDNPLAVAALEERSLQSDDSQIVARRVIGLQGNHRAYINGRLASIADLKAVIGPLIDLCGQHQHARLLDPSRQTLVLDRFAKTQDELRAHASTFATHQAASSRLRELHDAAHARQQRRDFLQFCADELADAAIKPGETESLAADARRLHGATELQAIAAEAHEALTDDGGVRDRLATVAAEIGRGVGLDGQLATMAEQAHELVTQLEELAGDIERYADRVDIDPQARDRNDERMAVVHRLVRKYGGSEAALLARSAEIDAELHEGAGANEELQRLEEEVPKLAEQLVQTAQALTAARREAAPRLASAAGEVLTALAMPDALLQIRLVDVTPIGVTGAERVVLHMQANRGGPTLPLREIASGGELSRTLLALERACADPSPSSSAVYDEIDAGIGGETGALLGHHLGQMARLQQVICITHLPQVAAVAGRQLHVSKSSDTDSAVSGVQHVDGEGRLTELARMLGGAGDPTALAHARSLLATGDAAQPVCR